MKQKKNSLEIYFLVLLFYLASPITDVYTSVYIILNVIRKVASLGGTDDQKKKSVANPDL